MDKLIEALQIFNKYADGNIIQCETADLIVNVTADMDSDEINR